LEEKRSKVGILTAALVTSIGVGVAFYALTEVSEDGDSNFSAFAPDESESLDAGVADASAPAPLAEPGLPDPSLAREKHWEAPRDAGPPPDGYGTHFVHLERRLHRHFRRQLGDAIELCLNEGRQRGESFDGRLVFHLTGLPRPGLKLGFQLNGVRRVGANQSADAGGTDLPSDILQCIWDTVEATEVSLPVQAAPLIAISQKPELFVDWEIQDQGPTGAIEAFDAGPAGD
jgi:hypothetical protein